MFHVRKDYNSTMDFNVRGLNPRIINDKQFRIYIYLIRSIIVIIATIACNYFDINIFDISSHYFCNYYYTKYCLQQNQQRSNNNIIKYIKVNGKIYLEHHHFFKIQIQYLIREISEICENSLKNPSCLSNRISIYSHRFETRASPPLILADAKQRDSRIKCSVSRQNRGGGRIDSSVERKIRIGGGQAVAKLPRPAIQAISGPLMDYQGARQQLG